MARTSRRKNGIEPCNLTLVYNLDDGDNYLDIARSLSRVNRKLFRQGRLYAIGGMTFQWKGDAPDANTKNLVVSVATAPNTWVVRNAWTKGSALWRQMQNLVLGDNPSVKGKWHDFKVLLDTGQITGNTRDVQNWTGLPAAGTPYAPGEWNLSTYVMPQHEVDPATGLPLAADEFDAVLIGTDSSSKKSLVKAYQESRAQVQAEPATDANMPTSFFNLLTDSGSQEPELALIIEDENEIAPYDMDEYPSGDVNAIAPQIQHFQTVSAFSPTGHISGFVAPCGLIQVTTAGLDSAGEYIPAPNDVKLIVHLVPGPYRGVLAEAM